MNSSSSHKSAAWLVAATMFLLFAAPRFRLVSAGAPVYTLDLLSFGCLVATRGIPIRLGSSRPLIALVTIFFTGVLLSQLSRIAFGPGSEEATYMLLRYAACTALFTSTLRVFSTEGGRKTVLRALAGGVLVTSIITVAYSIDATRGLTKPLFSIRALAPDSVGEQINLVVGSARRGRSLIGNETLTGCVLGVAWPLVMYLALAENRRGSWGRLASASALACAMALVATYSRGSVLMLVASAGILACFGPTKAKATVGWLTAILLVVFSGLNSLSNASMFDRLERRFASIGIGESDEELAEWGVSEEERFRSYTELASYLAEDPSRAALGWGNTRNKFRGPAATFPKHAVITAGTYHFGLAAGLAMSLLGPIIFIRSLRPRTRKLSLPAAFLGASAASMVAWQLIGHAPISYPRATSVFLVPVALMAATTRKPERADRTGPPSGT